MTSRDEQRRKRRSDSFRRDEADEADNWLAGLRGSGRGEPDPFAGPPDPFDRPGPPDRSGSFDFDRPDPMDRSGSFDRPGPLDRLGPADRPGPPDRSGSFDRPGRMERSGTGERAASFERPGRMERSGTGERAGDFDRTTAIRRPGADSRSGADSRPGDPRGGDPRGDSRTGDIREPRTGDTRRGRRSRDDSPSGVFGPGSLPPAAPPSRPANVDGWSTPDASAPPAGRRRAADDDSPSGVYGRPAAPPARPPLDQQLPGAGLDEPRGGRRRARDEEEARASESYDHGPQLTPIIKPLGELSAANPPADPPPLVPIFPNMRPDSSPTSGAARRARRAAEEQRAYAADPRTGDFTPRTSDFGPRTSDTGPRTGDLGSRTGDLGPRTGDLGSRTGDLGPRTGDLGSRTGDLGPRTGEVNGGGRRRAADEPRTGDAGGRRRAAEPEPRNRFGEPGDEANGGRGALYTGETTMFRPGDDTGARRRRDGANGAGNGSARTYGAPANDPPARGFDEDGPRSGAPYAGETTMFRPGEDPRGRRGRPAYDDDLESTGRRARAGFESAAPPETGRRDDSGVRRRDEAMRRRPAYDEPPQQRRAPEDEPGHDRYDEPSGARRGRGGRGSGEYTGEYTTGGTKRALREPPRRPDRGDPPERLDRLDRPRAVIDPVRPVPRPHRWVALLSAIAVVVVLGVCGVGTWFIFKDEKNGPESAKSGQSSAPKKRDISSRDVDPKALTEAEVFPSNNIVAVPDEAPYVILATKASNDCKVAATEQLATLLAGAGCSEVVRATMKSPNQEYLITAGIFNVTSEEVAAKTFDGIKPIVDGQKGRFAGMSVGAGTGTDALVRAPTQLGWNYKGHFITYCVIARVDGNNFTQGDPYPNQITYDIVETYLDNGIIENRSVIQPEATPAASLPGSAPPS
nr:hypothetical protein GCM10020063_095790 [Dactylosporangium thailandense]